MSKFINNVEQKLTGNKRYDPSDRGFPLLDVTEAIGPTVYFDEKREYFIGVTYGFKVYTEPKYLPSAKDNIVRTIRNDVYGDLLHLLHDLERRLYNRDFGGALSALRLVHAEVIGE